MPAEACGHVRPVMEGMGGSELGWGFREGVEAEDRKVQVRRLRVGRQGHFCSRTGRLQQLVGRGAEGRQESGHNLGGRWHSRLSITKARPLQKASLWPFWLPYPTLPCPFSEDLDPCEPQMVRA